MRFGIGVRFAGVPLPLAASRTSFAARITAPSSWHAIMSSTSAVRIKTSSSPTGSASVKGKAVTRSRAAPSLTYGVQSAPGYFNDQTNNTFTISWDAVPSQSPEDVFSGLSFGVPANGVTSYACIVRFNNTGNIDARNGGAYAAASTIPYTAGTAYHFRMVVRISNHTYDVFVTPQGQSELTVASNFAFRTEQASIATLDYLSKFITSGDATLSNMVGPPSMALAPVVTGQTTSLTTSGASFVAGETVCTVTALYEPTSWAITAGDPSGNFAIAGSLTGDFNATITVTSNGVSNLGGQTGTATLTIRATNASGTSANATATVNYAPASTNTIPMSFNDPIFTGMTEFTAPITMSGNQTLSHDSFVEQTGDPTISCYGTNNTISYCRVDSRECIRVSGQPVLIDHFYGRAIGSGTDHADCCQFYSPGANTTVTISNTHFVLGGASTAAIWVADTWSGDVHISNVICASEPGNPGGYGMRIYADPGCTVNVWVDGLFFVGPWSNGIDIVASAGGTMNVMQWNNVWNANIVNGVLQKTTQILTPGT